MGSKSSRLTPSECRVQHGLLELEEWSVQRVRKLITVWRPDRDALDTGALTWEEFRDLFRNEHSAEDIDEERLAQAKLSIWNGDWRHLQETTSVRKRNDDCDASETDEDQKEEEKEEEEEEDKEEILTKSMIIARDAATRIQKWIRGSIVRRRVHRLKAFLRWREFTFFDGEPGLKRLEHIFESLGRNARSMNPFDGRETIDALHVMLCLALTCKGTGIEKLDLLTDLLWNEPSRDIEPEKANDTDGISFEELVVMLIVLSKAIRCVFTSADEVNDSEEELEELAHFIFASSGIEPYQQRLLPLHFFKRWLVSCSLSAAWLARVTTDLQLHFLFFRGKLWPILIGEPNSLDATLFNVYQTQSPNGEDPQQSIALVDRATSQVVAVLDEQECVDKQLCFYLEFSSKGEETAQDWQRLYLATFTSACVLNKNDVSDDLFLGSSHVSLHQPPEQIAAEVPREYTFSMTDVAHPERIFQWKPTDWVGVFDVACPQGASGAICKQVVHRGVLERKCFTVQQLPSQTMRLVYFPDNTLEYIDCEKQLIALTTISTADAFHVGARIVAKLDTLLFEPCSCQDNKTVCHCRWIAGVVQVSPEHGVDGKAQLSFEYHQEQIEYSKEWMQPDRQRSDQLSFSMIRHLAPEKLRLLSKRHRNSLPSHGDGILCCRAGQPHVLYEQGSVLHSGWFHIRYITDDQESHKPLHIATSPSFQAIASPVELIGLREGTSIDQDIICDLGKIEEDYMSAVQRGEPSVAQDFFGLYPCDAPLDVQPVGEMFVRVSESVLSQSRVVFDPYYFNISRGGRFECRFVQQNPARVTSISKSAIVLPVILLKKPYGQAATLVLKRPVKGERVNEKLDNRIVCQFEIVDKKLWSSWDRVELILFHPDGDGESRVSWTYVTAKRMESSCASVILPSPIQEGTYKWRYVGSSKEMMCESENFFIRYETEEEAKYAGLSEEAKALKMQEEKEQENRNRANRRATQIQCALRKSMAKILLRKHVDAREESLSLLEEQLEEAKEEYVKQQASNARRNAALLSRKERKEEARLAKRVQDLEAALLSLKTRVTEEVLEKENIRVAQVREEARRSRQEREQREAHEAELRRRAEARLSTYLRAEPFVHPGCTQKLRWDRTVSSVIEEIADWVEAKGTYFLDESFSAQDQSLFKNNSSLKQKLKSQDIVWVRLSDFPRPNRKTKLVPDIPLFPERLHLGKVGALNRPIPRFLALLLEPLHLAFREFARVGTERMSEVLDTRFASAGLYGVKLFHEGEIHLVLIDDLLPCLAQGISDREEGQGESDQKKSDQQDDGRDEPQPLFSPFYFTQVGTWPLLLEKAVAKLFGSYELAFQKLSAAPQLAFQLLSGGLGGTVQFAGYRQTTLRLHPLEETFQDGNPTFNAPLGNAVSVRIEPGFHSPPFWNTTSLEQLQENHQQDQQKQQCGQGQQEQGEQAPSEGLESIQEPKDSTIAPQARSKWQLEGLVHILRAAESAQILATNAKNVFMLAKSNDSFAQVLAVRHVEVIEYTMVPEKEMAAESKSDDVTKRRNNNKNKSKAKRTTQVSVNRRTEMRMQRNTQRRTEVIHKRKTQVQRRTGNTASIRHSSDNGGEKRGKEGETNEENSAPKLEKKATGVRKVVLIKLRGAVMLEDQENVSHSVQPSGVWNDGSEAWSKVVREQVPDYDPIDDGTFWLELDEFLTRFEEIGWCIEIADGSDGVQGVQALRWQCNGDASDEWSLRAGFQSAGVRAPFCFENPLLEISTDAQDVFVQLEVPDHLAEVRLLELPPLYEGTFRKTLEHENRDDKTEQGLQSFQGFDLSNFNLGVALAGKGPQTLRLTMGMESESGKRLYSLQGMLWLPGLEGTCTIRIFALGSSKLQVEKRVPWWRNPTPEQVFQALPPLRLEERNPRIWTLCAVCTSDQVVCLTFPYKKNKQEPLAVCKSCWKARFAKACKACDTLGPPSVVPASLAPFFAKNNQVQSDEVQEQLERTTRALAHFFKEVPEFEDLSHAVDFDGVCESCAFRKRMDAADRCEVCQVAILGEEAQLNPPEQSTPERGVEESLEQLQFSIPPSKRSAHVHTYCLQVFKELNAERCAFCQGPLCKVPGRFSGEVKRSRLGFVHEECLHASLKASRQTKVEKTSE